MERAERSGGLHKRSAEAWGHPLRARGAELPLAGLSTLLGAERRNCFSESQGRRCGQDTGPLGWEAEDAGCYRRLERGKVAPSLGISVVRK